jgi:hypothetical protein
MTRAGRMVSYPGYRARSASAVCEVRRLPHAFQARPGSQLILVLFFPFCERTLLQQLPHDMAVRATTAC